MLGLVSRGVGVCLLPIGAVLDTPGTTLVAVADGPERTEHLAWSQFNPSPAALAFVGLVERAPSHTR